MENASGALARLEAICARAVERAFALAFPSELEPVQIARKLVAVFESGSVGNDRGGQRFIVQLNPADDARFSSERDYLIAQWNAMLARLAERSGRPRAAPDVRVVARDDVAAGTVAIAVEARPEPVRLALAMRRGLPRALRRSLAGTLTLGRDRACEFAIEGDPRVSRRHARVECEGGVRFTDLGSSNGTFLNGAKREAGELRVGDVLRVGDTEIAVVSDEPHDP